MIGNRSDRPILRRIFATTHQRDSVCSASNATVASFHSRSSIVAHHHVESRFSQWIIVNETPPGGLGGASDGPEIEEGSQIEEMVEGAEDILENDDDGPIHRTYQFDNCHVYINSFNVRGVKVKNSGNNRPRVTRMSCSLLQFSSNCP